MIAGPRRHWVQVFAATETVGDSGDVRRAWSGTAALELWAHKRTLTAGETTVALSRESNEDCVFEILHVTGITEQHRLLCNGEYFDITAIRDPDGLQERLHIYASSGKRYGA